MKLKLYSFISALLICSNMLADNEPWQNPQVNEINREPMHAHFIPFTNEANALKQHSLPADVRFNVNPSTERRISLDGTWKFLFSKNNELCPKDFHKPGYNTRKWSKIQVPGSWELQGFDAPIYTDTHSLPIPRMCQPITIRWEHTSANSRFPAVGKVWISSSTLREWNPPTTYG